MNPLFSLAHDDDFFILARPAELTPPCDLKPVPKGQRSAVQRAFRIMSPLEVSGVLITPSLASKSASLRDIQGENMVSSCDIAFHYGVVEIEGEVRVFVLRSTEYQGAFLKGQNNNIGVVVHGLSLSDERVTMAIADLIIVIMEGGDFPNIKNVISRPDADQNTKDAVVEIQQMSLGG